MPVTITGRVTRSWEVEISPEYGDTEADLKDQVLSEVPDTDDHISETISIIPPEPEPGSVEASIGPPPDEGQPEETP